MIALIYQHKADYPLDELINCLQNIRDNLLARSCFCISIVIDGHLDESSMNRIKKYLWDFRNYELSQTGEHVGISRARIKSVEQVYDKYKPSHFLFCCTNSKFTKPLSFQLYRELVSHKGLTAITYRCNDWLYDRDFSANKFSKLPIDYFISIQNKPDYLMMVDIENLHLTKPFGKEKYISEEVDWYSQCSKDSIINILADSFAECWFNSYGLTATNKDNWRQVEIDNSESFYYKAEFFLDKFLKNEIVLNLRQLKDYCSTLVSNHKRPIPFKKYKGTIIEPLLIERLKSWAENENFDNTFKIYEEK